MWQRADQHPAHACLIAHRAGAGLADGDPIVGVQMLRGSDTTMIEFDVRRTGDGVLVVHHDVSCGGMRLADYGYPDLQRAGLAPPLLADLLAAAAGMFALDVELKERGYEEAVIRSVLSHAPADKVVFTSFDDTVVAAVAARREAFGVGLIVGRRAGLRTPLVAFRDAFPFGRVERCGADFLVANRALLATGLLKRAARRDIAVAVWGVDDSAMIRRLRLTPGVVGVITDSPAVLLDSASSAGGMGEAQASEVTGRL